MGWGVRELGHALHLAPASAHRLLTILLRHGLVRQQPESSRYYIGAEFFRIALKLTSQLSIRESSLPIMQAMAAKCGETILLAYYDSVPMELMYIATVNSSHPLRFVVALNEWIPVYAGASGLAIMAFLPKAERERIVRHTGLKPLTPNTIKDPVLLETELERIRRRGYAFSSGHRNIGTVAFGAPVWGADSRPIGSLVVPMPEARFNRRMESRLARLIMQHADRITERIGGKCAHGDPSDTV